MEAFGEGWSCVNSGDSQWLDKQIRARGWYFIRSNEEVSGTGVGETTHEAIINALKLALRRVSDNLSASHVEHFEVIKYPGFFVAKVKIFSYQIQPCATLPKSGEPSSHTVPPLAKAVNTTSCQAAPAASWSKHFRMPANSEFLTARSMEFVAVSKLDFCRAIRRPMDKGKRRGSILGDLPNRFRLGCLLSLRCDSHRRLGISILDGRLPGSCLLQYGE